MVLIFGGTTEGRKAVEVLEAAGKPFYYSTKTGEQSLALHNGIAVDGAMDEKAMLLFCREHDIRLIIDAAHPFAVHLHETVATVAEALQLPLIRYDRIYPPRTNDIIWCRDYEDAIRQLERAGIERLLLLTGVQTLERLKPFWERHTCWCRILDRDTSRQLAIRYGFPENYLVNYDEENTAALIQQLKPQAILTKESGLSGGWVEKVEAAKAAGITVFAIERPTLNVKRTTLNAIIDGPHGLRRKTEQLLPDFFTLHSGLTTGTCATAAVIAATRNLLTGEQPSIVPVRLSNGETIEVPVGFSDGCAYCIKDFSDDPDVTRGCKIFATIKPPTQPLPLGRGEAVHSFRAERGSLPDGRAVSGSFIRFLQGEGVGRVTLPGLGIPVGEPAINPVPRQMITEAVRSLTDQDLDITISVENGRELAERTFNPRVGVVDGISIIGTSGIVQPLSNEAFIESIGRELEVARALGCEAVGLASGKRGEEALLAVEPSLRVIHNGNFIGDSLKKASALGFRRVVLGIMIGKAVKLAEGHLDTHSHKVTMNKAFLAEVATAAGVAEATAKLESITMARELWDLMPPAFFDRIHTLCLHYCRTVFPDGTLDIQLVKNE